MAAGRPGLINLVLVAVSLLVVFGLSVGVDRIFGATLSPPKLPGEMELIFPPNAIQHFESDEFAYTATINSLGLREREIPREHDGSYRICAIGDSYTYGWGVEQEDTWLRELERGLTARGLEVQTINLGKPGSGPPFYSELAERTIPILQPDLLIVGVLLGNDVASAGGEDTPDLSQSALTISEWLYPNITRWLRTPDIDDNKRTTEMPPQVSRAEDNRNAAKNRAQQFVNQDWNDEERAKYESFDEEVKTKFMNGGLNPYMVDLAIKSPHFYNITMNLEDGWLKQCIDRMSAHLARIKHVAQRYGSEVLVVTVPDGPYVNKSAWDNIQRVGYEVRSDMIDSTAPDDAVRIAAERAGLDFVSISDTFKARRDDPELFFELDGHMTAKGHELYGETLTPIIAERIEGGA